MYDAIVLGSGVVGLNTAYWLSNAGLKTLVVDRQPIAGNETSYANGGQISVSFAEPWAQLGTLRKALGWLLKKDAPLLIHPQWHWQQWRWIFGFLLQCSPAFYKSNVQQLVQLGLYSRTLLRQITQQHNLQYQAINKGIMQFYRTHEAFDRAKYSTDIMRQYGCDRQVISAQEAIALEPCLSHINQLVGATYTPKDGSGDAHVFCQELETVCKSMGVDFQYSTRIESLHHERGLVQAQVQRDNRRDIITAPHIIMCCGCDSVPLLKPLGVSLNLYPVKGYSITVPMQNPSKANHISLTDEANKIVYTRLGDQLRVAGTAELAGYDLSLNEARCAALVEKTKRLLPGIGGFDTARYWCGLRPMTPSNLPYVGATPYPNLWLNTGHGSLGWTLGCGSGRALSDLITHGHSLLSTQQEYKQGSAMLFNRH